MGEISCVFEVCGDWFAREINVAPIKALIGNGKADFPVQVTHITGGAAIGSALRALTKGVVNIGGSTSSIYLDEAILGIVGVAVIAVVGQVSGRVVLEGCAYEMIIGVSRNIEGKTSSAGPP